MTTCAYCGRENQDDAISCRECGSELSGPGAGTEPKEHYDFSWFKYVLVYSTMLIATTFLYLLSFGPITYYWGTTTRVVTPLTAPTGFTMVSKTSYPRWVAIAYYPALAFLSCGGLATLYSDYLAWWETPKAQKP